MGSLFVSDLINEDVKISKDGTVTGTIKYVQQFQEFSSDVSEQSGNYISIKLDNKYSGHEISVKRNDASEKKETDLNWILRIPSNSTTFAFKDGETEIVTLNFASATLEKE